MLLTAARRACAPIARNGRCRAGDATPARRRSQSALRELREELGLDLGADAVLGLLDDYPTRSGYLITPVVVWAGTRARSCRTRRRSPPCIALRSARSSTQKAFDFIAIPESTRRVIRFHWDERLIHAPTAAMIYQFREVLAGRDTRVADLEQPVFAWK